ncbi:hypothetical protein CYK25_003700 [Varibaculum cambriense]|uniref:hypothetical protein n=1 Tax=uncultured Varibaculum sp. TaxID=413896 RepID=UPI000C7B8ADC|nr:hypothetical protein [uncultured Varibaculum sp.]WIK89291.1 hypothetical protein CYK25_003700 [Varibaculum cambriense]
MDANAGSHGDEMQNSVPVTHPDPQTETGGNRGGTANDSKRYFPPRKAAAPAKKKLAPWRVLRWWPALAAVLAVAAAVVLGFYLWQAGRGQEMSGLSTQVKVSGQLGEQPVVQFQGRMPFTLPNSRVAIRGLGPQIQENQDVRVMVSVYEGNTGKLVSQGGKPQLFVGKANASTLPGGLLTEVIGRNEGSRLIVHRPATASDGKTSMEVDVIDVLPTAVYESQLQIPEAAGVSFTFPQGLPHFESAANTQPQEAATFVLVPGKGEQLDPRKKILAQYGVWELDSGKKRAYTWGNVGPQKIVGGSTFQSLSQQLTALRANSRILAIIPADQATGDSALAVVMDVLACAK